MILPFSPHSSGTGNAGQGEFRLNERNSLADCDARGFSKISGKNLERSRWNDYSKIGNWQNAVAV